MDISSFKKDERSFFENKKGEIEYTKTCQECFKECKQSYKTEISSCKLREKASSLRQINDKIKRDKIDVVKLGKDLKINLKTLNATLVGNKFMPEELHKAIYNSVYDK